uniref:Uncharacterized protein n=1 Tax=viral metagenome TaxID=1070528 RepID=A0A6C0E217_9ZZZZ
MDAFLNKIKEIFGENILISFVMVIGEEQHK